VRWYLRFRLSAANVRDLLAERGVDVSARTVLEWVQKFAPLLARAGRRAANRPSRRWWCDETYVRVGGQRAYLYRAIDEQEQVVDVLLRDHRDLASAGVLHPRAPPPQGCARRSDHQQAGGLSPGGPRRRCRRRRWRRPAGNGAASSKYVSRG
jgi:hypothetical protein